MDGATRKQTRAEERKKQRNSHENKKEPPERCRVDKKQRGDRVSVDPEPETQAGTQGERAQLE
jgi:hypothetical protein